MKKIFLFTILFPILAFTESKEVGNGGAGIACFNEKQELISAQLFDLWEGEILYNLKAVEDKRDVSVIMNEHIQTLTRISPSAPMTYQQIEKRIVFLPKNVGLRPINDLNEIIVPPQSCKVVQIANFAKDYKLYINTQLWELLDNRNKAALLVHEALYASLRIVNAKHEPSSLRTRRTVALLFSNTRLTPQMQDEDREYVTCSYRDQQNGNDRHFYLAGYEENSGVRIELSKVNGKRMIDRTSILIPNMTLTRFLTEKFFASDVADSQVDPHFVITFWSFEPNQFHISIRNSVLDIDIWENNIQCEFFPVPNKE